MRSHTDLVRQQWRDAYRELARGPGLDGRVREQVETVTAELRRRIGGSFTLDELATVYEGSAGWSMSAIEEQAASPGWVRTAASAADAAFYLYARGARDYRP